MPSWFDMQVHAGDALVTLMVGILGWGLRKSYGAVREFLEYAKETRSQLDTTSAVVDDHSRALLKAGIVKGPIKRTMPLRDHFIDDELES